MGKGKRPRSNKKHKKTFSGLIFAAVLLLLAGGAAVLFKIRPGWGFIIKDYFLRRSEKARYEIADPESVRLPEEELLSLAEKEPAQVVFDRSMLLINADHLLKEENTADGIDNSDAAPAPDITFYRDADVLMNTCIMGSYAALAAAVKERTGEPLYVRSAYRSAKEQEEEAEQNSEKAQAVGASEHQAGLALDVYVPYYAGSAIIKCPAGQYLNSECWRYGFIIRYPYFGKSKTGISYEPWHIRYVGAPHAELMYRNSLTLEEYMELLPENGFLKYGNYLITRQSGDSFTIPADFESAVISPDNCGGYVMTFLCGN